MTTQSEEGILLSPTLLDSCYPRQLGGVDAADCFGRLMILFAYARGNAACSLTWDIVRNNGVRGDGSPQLDSEKKCRKQLNKLVSVDLLTRQIDGTYRLAPKALENYKFVTAAPSCGNH